MLYKIYSNGEIIIMGFWKYLAADMLQVNPILETKKFNAPL